MKEQLPEKIISYATMLAVCCLLSLPACAKKESKVVADKEINVQVRAAEKEQLRASVDTIGTLNPYDEVTVSAELDGVLKEIRVEEGTPVSKGAILAAIDDTDYGLELRRSEAALRQAEATFENTKLEHQRKEALLKEELITKQLFDDISTRLAISGAEADRARSALLLSKQKLSKTKIYSSLSGFIKEKKVSTGDYARNGVPLFKIIQINPLKLNFTLTEKDAGRIKTGQDIIFRVDAFPGKDFSGKVTVVYPNLDDRTRTLQVQALVPNNNGVLKPGLFANVTLYTGPPKDTLLIPVTALLYEGEKVRVFVAAGGIAKEKVVKIGQKYSIKTEAGIQKPEDGMQRSEVREYTEIIEGIKEGEKVITVGQQNLSDGVKVNVAR